ncbi:hypothetical protein LIER_22937 [Lithospermum erythrorhizon]|uniref:Uncharacterized protein n=1 Tax=Lithospermum erythrorhizon TaxID=34254 RepID=A0AAV3QWW7_LITER
MVLTLFNLALAVGSAIAVICTPSETLSSILHGGRKSLNQTKTETSCDNQHKTFKDSIPCVNISKRMAQCLESNDYDVKNCIAYFDLLKECEKS